MHPVIANRSGARREIRSIGLLMARMGSIRHVPPEENDIRPAPAARDDFRHATEPELSD
jgi:hypothetical protein